MSYIRTCLQSLWVCFLGIYNNLAFKVQILQVNTAIPVDFLQ